MSLILRKIGDNMNNDLKKSIDIMNKIKIDSKVLIDEEWKKVKDIVPCKWQHDDEEFIEDICYYCIGKILLDEYFLDEPSCFCEENDIDFTDVMEKDFLDEKDMEIC